MNKFFRIIVLGLLLIANVSLANGYSKGAIAIPEWNKLGELDIIPCPKKMDVQHIQFLLVSKEGPAAVIVVPDNLTTKVRVATEVINNSVGEKGSQPLEIWKEEDLKGLLPEGKNVILLGVREKSKFLDKSFNKTGLKLDNYPLGEQGYVVHFLKGKKENQVLLTGLDDQGVLYAAVTFAELIQKKDETVIAKGINIIDWPDFKYRGGHGLKITNLEHGKRLVDWFLKYKFNLVHVWHRRLPPKVTWSWLKELNQYARDRQIRIMYSANWDIGSYKVYKDDPRFKGCIQFKGHFYCWSRDELLNEKIEDCKTFIRETGADTMFFHCLDSYDENWPERCDQCRGRFGDDRAAADAHVINLFTKGLRSVNKNILLSFVTQPYRINLNLPGNEKYKKYHRRLSSLIRPDVFLNATGYGHDAASSWSEVVKQPVVRWQNGSTFQWGRFFDSSPRFFKGAYFPDRRDMAFLNEPVVHFDGDIMQLVGIEYEWNIAAPGALILKSHPKAPIRERGPYKYRAARVRNEDSGHWLKYKATTEPKETCRVLLERICRKLYGTNIAPYMARYLRAGLTGWRGVHVAKSRVKNAKEAKEEYQRANRGCQILKEAMKNAESSEELSILQRFFNRTIHPKVFYATYALALQAEEEVKKANISTAQKLVDKCKAALESSQEELRKEGAYGGFRSETWLKPVEEKIKLVKLKIKISGQKSSKESKTNIKPDAIRVAVYNPNERGGKAVYVTVFNCLNKQPGIHADAIDNLELATLKKYQVLILCSCKKVAESDGDFWRNIKQFVVEDGGNLILQHDSVGFYRTTDFKESLFPEICLGGNRRRESVKVKVVATHPSLGNLKLGEEMEHMYWDHITLKPGPKGKIIVEDIEGSPLVIVGQVGKGKVIFNGMVTFGRNGKEKEDAALIDKILLVNGTRWLAGK